MKTGLEPGPEPVSKEAVMDLVVKQLEEMNPLVGAEAGERFERGVLESASELMRSLETKVLDDQLKLKYVASVFNKTLLELVESMSAPRLVN